MFKGTEFDVGLIGSQINLQKVQGWEVRGETEEAGDDDRDKDEVNQDVAAIVVESGIFPVQVSECEGAASFLLLVFLRHDLEFGFV